MKSHNTGGVEVSIDGIEYGGRYVVGEGVSSCREAVYRLGLMLRRLCDDLSIDGSSSVDLIPITGQCDLNSLPKSEQPQQRKRRRQEDIRWREG
jgi:hypothetical protein